MIISCTLLFCGDSIMDRERRLSILYQKQGRAAQFANKAARDDWLQKEIKDLELALLSNRKQVPVSGLLFAISLCSSVLVYCSCLLLHGTILHLSPISLIHFIHLMLIAAGCILDPCHEPRNLFFSLFNYLLIIWLKYALHSCKYAWQEGLLQEEIQKLKDEMNNLTSNIESWKSESGKLYAVLAKRHNDYNDTRKKRDEFQEKRKYVDVLLTSHNF